MNILLTNVTKNGESIAEDGITDVMVFCETLTTEELAAAYRETIMGFDECYEVPDDDVGTYIYEPCWLTEAEETQAKKLAARYLAKHGPLPLGVAG